MVGSFGRVALRTFGMFFIAPFLSTCSEGAPPSSVSVIDSAGVLIVTTIEPQWSPQTAWEVVSQANLSIHEREGQPETQFYLVTDGLLLDDGRIIIANCGSAEIQVFGVDGGFRATWGGPGEGPGEFDWIESLDRAPAGRVFAYDDHLGRGTLFGSDGTFHRTIPVRFPPGIPASDAMVLPTGDLIGVLAGPTSGLGGSFTEGLVTNDAVVIHLSSQGEPGDTVVVAPGDELLMVAPSSGRGMAFSVPAFGLNRAVLVHRGRVFVRTGRGREVAEYDLNGHLKRLIKWRGPDLTVTPEKLEAGLRSLFGGDESVARRYDLPVPETAPAFGRLMFDSEGYLWVSEYAQYLQDPKNWSVFDSLGVYLGDVEFPDRFKVLDIRGNQILGRRKDDLDREVIELLDLRRGMPGG